MGVYVLLMMFVMMAQTPCMLATLSPVCWLWNSVKVKTPQLKKSLMYYCFLRKYLKAHTGIFTLFRWCDLFSGLCVCVYTAFAWFTSRQLSWQFCCTRWVEELIPSFRKLKSGDFSKLHQTSAWMTENTCGHIELSGAISHLQYFTFCRITSVYFIIITNSYCDKSVSWYSALVLPLNYILLS